MNDCVICRQNDVLNDLIMRDLLIPNQLYYLNIDTFNQQFDLNPLIGGLNGDDALIENLYKPFS